MGALLSSGWRDLDARELRIAGPRLTGTPAIFYDAVAVRAAALCAWHCKTPARGHRPERACRPRRSGGFSGRQAIPADRATRVARYRSVRLGGAHGLLADGDPSRSARPVVAEGPRLLRTHARALLWRPRRSQRLAS